MKSLEQLLVRLDSAPWNAVYRGALGFCIPPVLRLLSGGSERVWMTFALFIGLLIALRVGPALSRAVLPFSAETKSIWFQRRQIAKQHDSYQWQKLFWMGLGMLGFGMIGGGLGTGELLLAATCLVGGAIGLLLWQRNRPRVVIA